MRVWWLVHERRAATAFDGQGAYRFGGRWNPKGVRCVYTAGTSALAVLEVLVHMEKRHLGVNYRMIAADLPDNLAIEVIDPASLPDGWRVSPPPLALHRIGEEWASSGRTAALRVPSALAPGESNYLLNPEHPAFKHITIGNPAPYAFDSRLL